ncbi:MAG: hypothetical protein N2712_01535 [Brevinematales bacterium]|nr:hypothetical protein [Brevinematales bacterium]
MRFYIVLTAFFTILLVSSCGINFFSPLASKDYGEANLYQSRNLIDQGRYAEFLSNADKYPAQDHVVAALGAMGFDLKILTNIAGGNSGNNQSLLLGWIDKGDINYVLELSWGLTRLKQEGISEFTKSVVLLLGGLAQAMLGIMILADYANTNAINTQDGISENELSILLYWLLNPVNNITNLYRIVGTDRAGNTYSISKLIGTGTTSLLVGISGMVGNIDFSSVSNIFSSLDSNNDGNIDDTEVSNLVVQFLSNMISNL